MYDFLKWGLDVDILRRKNMTYETSNRNVTEFVKSQVWTHAFSQEPELESIALCIKK